MIEGSKVCIIRHRCTGVKSFVSLLENRRKMGIQLELTWAPVKPNSLIKAENRPGSDSSKHQSPADIFFSLSLSKIENSTKFNFPFSLFDHFFGALTDRGKKISKNVRKKGRNGRGARKSCKVSCRVERKPTSRHFYSLVARG